MSLVAFATNAVQYTPFPPIDEQILIWHGPFSESIKSAFAFTDTHASLKKLFNWCYASLDYQMAFLPLLSILLKDYETLHRYYQHLLLTLLLGFTCYYFFPTIAPASLLKLPYFSEAQYATGLKFKEIHEHLPPSTIEGGLIAFPSFHAIWAILCLILVKKIRFLFYPLLLNNIVLIASCVLLGWHYPLDIIAGIALVFFSFMVSIWFNKFASRQPAVANCDSEIIMARRG